jgi:hypothetical protein
MFRYKPINYNIDLRKLLNENIQKTTERLKINQKKNIIQGTDINNIKKTDDDPKYTNIGNYYFIMLLSFFAGYQLRYYIQ